MLCYPEECVSFEPWQNQPGEKNINVSCAPPVLFCFVLAVDAFDTKKARSMKTKLKQFHWEQIKIICVKKKKNPQFKFSSQDALVTVWSESFLIGVLVIIVTVNSMIPEQGFKALSYQKGFLT